MDTSLIITISVMGVAIIGIAIMLIVALVKGNLKEFVMAKMEEAEATGKEGKEKLIYVLDAVKEKYKLAVIISTAKKIVEVLIDFSKKVNTK